MSRGTVLLSLLFGLACAYSPMHLKKQGLQNIVPHSLTNCYGITGSDFVDLSHLHGKVMTGFATGENVTVVLQFCYAVWTAYGPTEYTDGLQHSNAGGEHKMGHTLGYYKQLWAQADKSLSMKQGSSDLRSRTVSSLLITTAIEASRVPGQVDRHMSRYDARTGLGNAKRDPTSPVIAPSTSWTTVDVSATSST